MSQSKWPVVALSELTEKIMVGIASAATHAYVPSGIPMLRNLNIKEGGIDETDVLYIDEVYEFQHRNKRLREGDIITVRTGYPGISAVVPKKYEGAQCFTSLIIRPNEYRLNPHYFCQVINSEYGKRLVKASEAGGAQKNLNAGTIESFPVPLPSLEEQQNIVRIVSIWDQAIATTERLIANSRQQWQALIGVTLHLPSANPDSEAPSDNGGFPASVQPGIPTLPAAPAGWRRIRLGDHLNEVRRPVALIDDLSYTLVTVKRSRGGVQQREVLLGSEVKTPSQFFVHAGDFLISKRQIVHGACGIVPQALHGAVVSNEYAVLNSDTEIDLQFLRYLSESRYFQQTCFHSSIGVHVEKMIFKTERWLSWPLNIPPLAQQQRIVEILDTASRELTSIARQLDSLKQEKAALMSQLLTGKRRVNLPQQEASA